MEEQTIEQKPKKKISMGNFIVVVIIITLGVMLIISLFFIGLLSDKMTPLQNENTYLKTNLNITCQLVNIQGDFIGKITNTTFNTISCEQLLKSTKGGQ